MNRLHRIADRVIQKPAVVRRSILRTQARLAVIFAAGIKTFREERINGGLIYNAHMVKSVSTIIHIDYLLPRASSQ